MFYLLFWCSFFKECPHPDEKQRLELSRRLGLETKQIKFWFQNRRTQMKVKFVLLLIMYFLADRFCIMDLRKMKIDNFESDPIGTPRPHNS